MRRLHQRRPRRFENCRDCDRQRAEPKLPRSQWTRQTVSRFTLRGGGFGDCRKDCRAGRIFGLGDDKFRATQSQISASKGSAPRPPLTICPLIKKEVPMLKTVARSLVLPVLLCL